MQTAPLRILRGVFTPHIFQNLAPIGRFQQALSLPTIVQILACLGWSYSERPRAHTTRDYHGFLVCRTMISNFTCCAQLLHLLQLCDCDQASKKDSPVLPHSTSA